MALAKGYRSLFKVADNDFIDTFIFVPCNSGSVSINSDGICLSMKGIGHSNMKESCGL